MRSRGMDIKPRCFRCGKEAEEFLAVSIRWNTYKGSGSCFAALCNNCIDDIEPQVKVFTEDITKDVNK